MLDIIKEEKDILPRAFRYIVSKSRSNYAPYHSLNHVLRVMYYCNEGCTFHSITGKLRVNILLAALFHDFNHSMGERPDSENVEMAIAGVKDFYESVVGWQIVAKGRQAFCFLQNSQKIYRGDAQARRLF